MVSRCAQGKGLVDKTVIAALDKIDWYTKLSSEGNGIERLKHCKKISYEHRTSTSHPLSACVSVRACCSHWAGSCHLHDPL